MGCSEKGGRLGFLMDGTNLICGPVSNKHG
jgi:hypothetical protein